MSLLFCLPLLHLFTHMHSYILCVSDSDPPLSDKSQHFSDPGLISLLRAELGLSSSDLFSMTVSDYDMKPNVRQSCSHREAASAGIKQAPLFFQTCMTKLLLLICENPKKKNPASFRNSFTHFKQFSFCFNVVVSYVRNCS